MTPIAKLRFALLFATSGCAAVFGIPSDVEPQPLVADAAVDSSTDGGPSGSDAFVPDAPPEASSAARCKTSTPFGAPVVIDKIARDDEAALEARLAVDELTMYFTGRKAGDTSSEIYVATRPNRNAEFTSSTKLAAVNDPNASDSNPNISADGLTLTWVRNGGLMRATRAKVEDAFGALTPITVSDGGGQALAVATPFIHPDRPDELWFASGTPVPESNEVFFAKLEADSAKSAAPVAPVNDVEKNDQAPVISADGLTLYFAKVRAEDANHKRYFDVWMAERATRTSAFGKPVRLESLVGMNAIDTLPTWISRDDCRLYLWRYYGETPGSETVLVATRPVE